MKKILLLAFISILALSSLIASGSKEEGEGEKIYKIGMCNYVDDASLNQICQSIEERLEEIEEERGVNFVINYDNCNADASILQQIIANYQAEEVDLMIAIATPVAMAMQAQTEEDGTPIVFAAVSDPVGAGVVDSMDKPGHNITGTSDSLDTSAMMNLITQYKSDIKKVGLLYDLGQDSSTSAIKRAKEILKEKNIEVVEKTGTNVDEVMLAASSLVSAKVEAVFTPTDNTVMTAELSIYELFKDNKIAHFAGADSFALNGAFLGYGVDYINLGRETADIVSDILLDGKDISTYPVKTFDNGTATINREVMEALGYTEEDITKLFSPYCTKVQFIDTSESF